MPTKISQLPAIATSAGSDVLPSVQAGVTYKATITQITAIETAARIAADNTLTTNLTSEAATRASAVTTLQANINGCLQANGSVAMTANLPSGGFKITGLAAGSGAGDSVRYEQVILAAGTNAFTGNQPMGSNKLTDLSAGSGNGDSVRYEQVLLLAGGTMSGIIAMGANKITGIANGTASTDVAAFGQLATSAWGISGSTGTTAGTNYIGTGDAVDAVFKANGTEAFRIDNDNQFIGFGQTDPTALVHIGAGAGVGTEVFIVSKGQNSNTRSSLVNLTDGTASKSQFLISSDSTQLNLTSFASSFTTSGIDVASTSSIVGFNGGLNIGTGGGNTLGLWTNSTKKAYIDTNGNFVLGGTGSALATNATNGFTYLPSCAGAATGVPASLPTGAVPVVFDTTNGKIWVYYGAAWHFVALT